MIKKLLLALLLVLVLAVPVMADQTYVEGESFTLGIKDMNIGTYYVKENHTFSLGAQLNVLSWKDLLSLNVGVITADGESYPLIGGIGLNVNTLAKICHLEYHLPGDLQLGLFIGRNFKENYQEGKFWGFSMNTVWDFSQ